MEGVDKEHVKRVVYEMSKVWMAYLTLVCPFTAHWDPDLRLEPWHQDSAHFKNEQRKQEAVNAKVARLKVGAGILQTHQVKTKKQGIIIIKLW